MALKEIITDSRDLVISVAAIIGVSMGAIAFFAPAADLQSLKQDYYQHKVYQRLNYIDQRIGQLEIRYDCIGNDCRNKMPVSVFEEYTSKLSERNFINKQILRPEDIK